MTSPDVIRLMGMVRVMDDPSPPSAKTNLPFFRSAPAICKRVIRGTPVNSLQEIMPWVYCTVGTATLPHSVAVLAPHSMKAKRDTDGKRMISSMVKTMFFLTMPLIMKRCLDGSMSHQPWW